MHETLVELRGHLNHIPGVSSPRIFTRVGSKAEWAQI